MGFLVYYIRTMPVEACVAALACMLNKSTQAIGMTIDQAKDEELKLPTTYDLVIFLGNYWDTQLKTYFQKQPFDAITTDIVVYSFGNDSPFPSKFQIAYVVSKDQTPVGFFKDLWNKYLQPHGSGVKSVYFALLKPVLDILDDRVRERNLPQTQVFFSGLANHPAIRGDSVFERFSSFLRAEATLETIEQCGMTVLESQMKLTADRAKTNSTVVKLSNGRTAAVTDAPDLINLSHDALKKAYPEVDLTLVSSFKFAHQGKVSISYSYRSTENLKCEFHLGNEMEKHEGGGSKTAAATRIEIKFDPPC